MAKFSDIKSELLTTFQAALDEFVAAAETAEARGDDPVSIVNVKVSVVGTSDVDPKPGTRTLSVQKSVKPS